MNDFMINSDKPAGKTCKSIYTKSCHQIMIISDDSPCVIIKSEQSFTFAFFEFTGS